MESKATDEESLAHLTERGFLQRRAAGPARLPGEKRSVRVGFWHGCRENAMVGRDRETESEREIGGR